MDGTGCERSELRRLCCENAFLRRYCSFNGLILLRHLELLTSTGKSQKLTAISLSKPLRVLVHVHVDV